MPLDFDVETFLHNLKATKPPYECPVESCGKVYKSFSGIQVHLENYDHSIPTPVSQSKSARKKGKARRGGQAADRSPSPAPVLPVKAQREPRISYVDATKMLEYETDGGLLTFSIYDNLTIMSKTEYEALVPPPPPDPVASPEPGQPAAAAARHGTPRPPGRSASGEAATRHPSQSGDERRHRALPEAAFSEDDDYQLDDAPPMPTNYIRFIEKSLDELDEEVEYDMDEEDVAWLDITNQQRAERALAPVKDADFELLMDRLEKESYFQAQTTVGTNVAPIDEEAVCCICMDGECENSNVILFCDMCNLPVHQECYGVPYIPEGPWWCRRCLQSPSRAVDCVLCPNKGGAFKQTDDNRWAHVVCALWVPEVCFANTVFLEPIDSLDRIPPARWKLSCYICKQRNVGACIQCHKDKCYTAFHVTCAQQAGMHMKVDAIRETSSTGTSFIVRKAAYCDIHTPIDSDAKPQLDEAPMDSARKAQAKAESRQKMRKARKILAERRSALPVVSVPTIPPERVQHLASLIECPRKNHFIQRLLAYWTLKRYSRYGVPLLRRLQVSAKQARRADSGGRDPLQDKNEIREQIKYWQRLRQDLEKVRLLCELIRKREKTKRELIKVSERERRLRLAPLQFFLEGVVEQISARDQGGIFAEPVDTDEVTDYLSVISEPMDLSTMARKVRQHEYSSLPQLVADFDLMIQNCLTYNGPATLFYKAGVKLRDAGGAVLRKAAREMEQIGFDSETGLLLTERPPQHDETLTDEDVLEQVDQFLSSSYRETMNDEEQMDALLRHLDRVTELRHGGSRVKWTKALRVEISKLRRKKALALTGATPGRRPAPATPATPSQPGGHKRRRGHSGSSGSDDDSSDGTEEPAETASGRSRDPSPHETEPQKSPPAPQKKRARTAATEEGSPADPKSAAGRRTVPGKRGRPSGRRPQARGASTGGGGGSSGGESRDGTEGGGEGSEARPASPSGGRRQGGGGRPAVGGAASSPAGVNRRTAVLFTKKAAGMKGSPSPQKKDGRRKSRSGPSQAAADDQESAGRSKPSSSGGGPSLASRGSEERDSGDDFQPRHRASFTQYRQGRDVAPGSDEDTASEPDELPPPGLETGSEDSELDSELEDADISSSEIPLEPLDIVWAKCRGFPWYPALIIDPKMPRTGYFHNLVPIPVPPEDVLALAANHTSPMYLVLFFDAKRTWQWLPRTKLEPLGVDPALDKAKLVESRKANDRKAVKTAYEKAILHQCRVTGKSAKFSLEDKDKSAVDVYYKNMT
ncbi:bromodomain-containing protein 1-like [Amphibalanus amphitrite]|uniref:bromodomain-containing protein 1-like n=1 Tax=Amphibalanus amphitrite TaxID=1232801 RepID=UPI001C90E9BC|nr:bromodomain-containing protein 1-like [Amphibalanus amphitrite]